MNIFKFPESLQFKLGDSIDNGVKAFSRNNRELLSGIRSAVIFVIQGINTLLSYIPWFVLIFLIIIIGWKLSKKWYVGALYGFMLFFIGSCGLWSHMLETLSIVIASVIVCLLLGFPIGIIVATGTRLPSFILPVLDLMQTMPAFVYLVPAVILFSPGKTPALMATVICAIVPMIRMTSHGIRYVDAEMIEAGKSFGSTKMQMLTKIQIPQAMPSIMTGVNQTIMMAMSMVVTCALIGANGLGMEILIATNRTEMSRALLPGLAIVFVAIILDRITQGLIKKPEVNN